MEIFESITDIGLIRERNEDAVLSIKHPKNKKIKLLVVADGMGGKQYGDIAANYVISTLKKWFQNKSIKTINNTLIIEKLLKKYIKTINTNIIKKYGEDKIGTTLTLAIINKCDTLIINIGDSRAYIYRKRKLIQLTEDDSDVWTYYKYGIVKKEDLRFFPNNNIITACVGICNELCKISSKIIKNDYEILLLLTDGVTDLVTDKKIKKILKKTPKDRMLAKIIYEAVHINQHINIPFLLKRKKLTHYITPFKGRDNASGVIFIK